MHNLLIPCRVCSWFFLRSTKIRNPESRIPIQLWRPLLLGLALMWRPGLLGRPRAIHPVGLRLHLGGGTKRTKKLRKLEQIAKIKKSWKSHKKSTPIHGDDALNAFEINWAKQYLNCERYKKMWQDALNGNCQDGVRLVDNKLVRNGWWCVSTPLVHGLVAEYHNPLPVWKNI